MDQVRRQIVVATDEAFVVPTATTLRSISLHDSGPIDVTILSSAVTTASRERIQSSLAAADMQLRWIDTEDIELGDTSKSPIGRATYLRLAIGELMPAEVDSVLYLDVDILVEDDLTPLWELAQTDAVLHAVRSINYPAICSYGAADHWPELGIDPRAPYFNAGVLMINLRRWRELDIGQKALDFLASPLWNGKLADQEALNAVLAGQWSELHPRWNVQTLFYENSRGIHLMYDDETIESARMDPAIVHFTARPKPWHRKSTHQATDRWRQLASETSFAPVELDYDTAFSTMRSRAKRAASILLKG